MPMKENRLPPMAHAVTPFTWQPYMKDHWERVAKTGKNFPFMAIAPIQGSLENGRR